MKNIIIAILILSLSFTCYDLHLAEADISEREHSIEFYKANVEGLTKVIKDMCNEQEKAVRLAEVQNMRILTLSRGVGG